MPDLSTYRAEFPILSRSVYMISNSLGAMPRGVSASLADYAEIWATRGVRAWAERWWTMGTEVGDAIGRLIGAPAGSVSMHENVTTAHAVALSCLPVPGRRRRIVCCAGDFPSTIYLLRAQHALGFELTIVPAEADFTVDAARIVDAIDETTAIVAISHVLFRSSFIVDPRPIIERAHAVGAQVVLDTYQSAGIIPVDVTALGVDFATGGLPEVAVRWSGKRVPVHASGPAANGAAAADRLVLAHRAVRVRSRCVRAAGRCAPDDERHAVDPGMVRGAAGTADSGAGRYRRPCAPARKRSLAACSSSRIGTGSTRLPRGIQRSWPAR